jgi:hypothetical protein
MIFPIPNGIFPGGKVKYSLRKYEILLTQYEICPFGHIVVALLRMVWNDVNYFSHLP